MSAPICLSSRATEVQAAAKLEDPDAWRHFRKATQVQYKWLQQKYPHINSWQLIPYPDQKVVETETFKYLEEKGVTDHKVNNAVINWRMVQQYKPPSLSKRSKTQTGELSYSTPQSSSASPREPYDPIRDPSFS